MSHNWRLEPYGALRVSTFAAESLSALRLRRAPAVLEAAGRAAAQLSELRAPLVDELFNAVKGCTCKARRRNLLALKRQLFNGKEIGPLLSAEVSQSLPAGLLKGLLKVAAVEAEVEALEKEFPATFEEEGRAVSAALLASLEDPLLLSGLLLSGQDVWRVSEQLAGSSPQPPAERKKQEATIGRYLFRAATRTTPFGGFTGVAILRLAEDGALAPSGEGGRPPEPAERRPAWRSVAQLHVGLLTDWMRRSLQPAALARLPLRVTPLVRVEEGSRPSALFAQSGADETSQQFGAAWATLVLDPEVRKIMDSARGLTRAELAETLAADEAEVEDWLGLIDFLVGAEFLERVPPYPESSADGLRRLSARLERLGDSDAAGRMQRAAGLLERYADSAPAARAEVLAELDRELGPHPFRAPVFEDVMLDGLTRDELGVGHIRFDEDLLPALALARASLSDAHHQLMCNAFVREYGAEGACEDVPGFLIELLRDDSFMLAMRQAFSPPGWMNTPLAASIQEAEGACARLDSSLFEALPAPDVACSVAAFVQVVAADQGALRRGEYRLVLNGMQSGRGKYLSRYLGGGAAAPSALSAVRARLSNGDGPLPVEILPALGLNFQLHPPLTEYLLELPREAVPESSGALPLADLRLRYDHAAGRLRVYSRRLAREIEPVHLGFLRDLNLPDALFLLRALSPRVRDDTFAERADIYNLLDGWHVANNVPLRPFRPRLEVGRLVLERARWAVPLPEVPLKLSQESDADYFRRLWHWRAGRGLPERGFAKRFSLKSDSAFSPPTPLYVDWHSPLTLQGVKRLVLGQDGMLDPDGWLIVSELLPAPEDSHFKLGGRARASELLVQYEWNPGHG